MRGDQHGACQDAMCLDLDVEQYSLELQVSRYLGRSQHGFLPKYLIYIPHGSLRGGYLRWKLVGMESPRSIDGLRKLLK